MDQTAAKTYTPNDVHERLDVSKSTLRAWTLEYAGFLSGRAYPDASRSRRFTHDDLIVLNTIRHLTRVEGMTSSEVIREALRAGKRVTVFPDNEKMGNQVALARTHLPLNPARLLQAEMSRLTAQVKALERERDLALIALDEANQRIARLLEDRGRLLGIMSGMAVAGGGIVLLVVVILLGLAAFR